MKNRAQQLDQICYSSVAAHSYGSLLTSLIKVRKCAREKPFSLAKLAYVQFSSPTFDMQVHIMSTGAHAFPSASEHWT